MIGRALFAINLAPATQEALFGMYSSYASMNVCIYSCASMLVCLFVNFSMFLFGCLGLVKNESS